MIDKIKSFILKIKENLNLYSYRLDIILITLAVGFWLFLKLITG